jgi:phage FluMu gp28-like protein
MASSHSPAVPLYEYQKQWLLDQSRFKIGMFARQTGKTFTTTLELVDDCFNAEALGSRARWVILSRGERQAREAMEQGVKKHARAYQLGIKEIEGVYRGEDKTEYLMLDIVLPGGSQITALPANPDTARGFSANVFLDEFAFHADSRKIWGALFPVISAGYKLRVTSTPNGKGNKFYELMTAEDAIWSRHRVDIYQAVANGLPRNVDELRAALNDEDLWKQEFELNWLDEASAWIDYELINACEDDAAGDPHRYAGGPCYIGVDIGRRKDLFVIWVLEKVGDVFWTREIIARSRITFAEQDQLLDEVILRYDVVRAGMDQTGMGEKPVEDAQRLYGESRVEGVVFTAPAKLKLATVGKQTFQDRRIRIPRAQREVRADLHSLKKETSLTGVPRFVVEEEDGVKSHADRAWACFLAVNAGTSNPPAPIEFQALGVQRAGRDVADYLGRAA